jgi:hypothetical protein
VAESDQSAIPPTTTTIESAGTRAHQRPRKLSSQAGNGRAAGSATSAAWTRLRIAIETANEGIGTQSVVPVRFIRAMTT